MKRKINYIIATWGQRRKCPLKDYPYLAKHIEQLNKIKHELCQVTVGRPECPNELPYYTECIENLKSLDDGTPVVVHEMPNTGVSYGQYSRIFDMYRDQFTHYIFMEDDYIPVEDNFDTTLAEMFDQMNCGYLCGLVFSDKKYRSNWGPHAGVSNGISSYEVLKAIWDIHGCLPHIGRQRQEQIVFSQGFLKNGHTIEDYLHKYRTLYFQHTNSLRVYGDLHSKDIIIPIQCLEKKEWKFKVVTSKGQSEMQIKNLFD